RRHRDVVGGGEGGGVAPSGDAADPAEVGHDEIAGVGAQRGGHGFDAVEVLAELQWYVGCGGDCGVAVQIVVADRVFEPENAFRGEGANAYQRFFDRQGLVVVDHYDDARADGFADGFDCRQIFGERRITEPQLDRLETAVEKLERLIGDSS